MKGRASGAAPNGRDRGVHLPGHPGGMILTEPDARIEGDAVEVLALVFAVTVELLEESMDKFTADHLAHVHLSRVHAVLAQAGHVVRDLEEEDHD